MNELIKPTKNKVILFLLISIIFWFFPIISSSIFAIPFTNLSSLLVSIIINLIIAYIFSCLIIKNSLDKKKLMGIIIILLIIYLIIPKISTFDVGDIGGRTNTYGVCYGLEYSKSKCCGSTVKYCSGLLLRNEKVNNWPPYI